MNVLRIATLVLVASIASAWAQGKPQGALTGAAIKARFSGWAIYGVTPSDHVFEVTFRPDGTLIGMTHKDSDKGRWWVEGDTLCRNWKAWSYRPDKKEQCFYVVLEDDRVKYYEKDGTLYRDWGTAPHR